MESPFPHLSDELLLPPGKAIYIFYNFIKIQRLLLGKNRGFVMDSTFISCDFLHVPDYKHFCSRSVHLAASPTRSCLPRNISVAVALKIPRGPSGSQPPSPPRV